MATMSLAAASPLTSILRGLAVSTSCTAFVGLRVGGSSAARFPGLAAAAPPAGRGEAAVVRMAKREQELEEIRAMTTEQLEEEVVDLKGELFLLRLKRSARQEFKSSEFGRMRKRVIILSGHWLNAWAILQKLSQKEALIVGSVRLEFVAKQIFNLHRLLIC